MLKKIVFPLVLSAAFFLVGTSAASAASGVWARSGSSPHDATVGWSSRGGDCHIKYTEADQHMYKYATATSCSNGSVEIGHLTPGVQYRFIVKQNGSSWSAPVWARAGHAQTAKRAHAVARVEVTRHQAAATMESPAETLPADDYPTRYQVHCGGQGSMHTLGQLNRDERRTGKCGAGITNFRTVSGQRAGEVTVYWSASMLGADNYHLMYGTESGHYTMGALNIGGESHSFTVRGLSAGQRYYFKLIPVKGGQALGSSWEVSDIAR